MAVEYVNSLMKKVGIKVISKAQKPDPFGMNDEIPEGIFGVIERHVQKTKRAARALARATQSVTTPDVSAASSKPKKTADASSASKRRKKKPEAEAPRIIGLTPAPTIEQPANPQPVIVETPRPIKKKKKQIIIESEPLIPKKRKKKVLKVAPISAPIKKVRAPQTTIMPKLEINYDSMMPPEAEGLKLENVVSIPEDILRSVARKTEQRTKALSRLLLNGSAPAMLSYDAASNYVKAVLSDGLKIDVDVDRGVLGVVQDMARLDVVHFYLKRLSLPKSMKKQFMSTFIDELSKASLETMLKTNKSDTISSQLRELEAVVYKRSEHQAKEQNAKARNGKRIGLTTEEDAGSPMPGTKKTRRDGPMMGGF